jgi:hypothetical protein
MFEKNINTIFLLPTLKLDPLELKTNGFINCYEQDVKKTSYEDCIYAVFKPPNLDVFKTFLDNLYENRTDVIEDYDDSPYVVVVFKLTDAFKEDINLVKKGKYSKTSKEFRKLFPQIKKQYINGVEMSAKSLQWQIFDKDLKSFWEKTLDVELDSGSEVWETYLQKNEIYNYEQHK